jgi:hypothetical protein
MMIQPNSCKIIGDTHVASPDSTPHITTLLSLLNYKEAGIFWEFCSDAQAGGRTKYELKSPI